MSTPILTEAEILERFAAIVASSLRIQPGSVTADADLSELGAESLDLLEITMQAEDEFGIVMPQKDILQVAEEVFGAGVLVQDGLVTAGGLKLLQQRMPELAATFSVGMPVAEVGRVFHRVGTWVRVIKGISEQSPTTCPACGGALSKPIAARLTCAACGAEVDLPAGDDLNRRWVEDYKRADQAAGSDEGAQVA